MRFNYEIKKSELRPDITPLIDVVFLLLIFFMLASNFVYSTSIKVDLPKAKSATAAKDNPVKITIDKESKLFFDDKQITLKELGNIFQSLGKGPVSIFADKDAPIGIVIEVWDLARLNELNAINIQTTN